MVKIHVQGKETKGT